MKLFLYWLSSHTAYNVKILEMCDSGACTNIWIKKRKHQAMSKSNRMEPILLG